MSLFNRCVTPVASFRFARWPFTIDRSKKLDAQQRRMIRLAVRVRRLSGETDELYCRRAAHVVSDVHFALTPWSLLWAVSTVNWASHLFRNTAGASWAANLLTLRSTSELEIRRALNSNRRPGTRSASGFMCRRWTDSVSTAISFIRKFSTSRKPYGNSFRHLDFQKTVKFLNSALSSCEFIEQNSSHL